MDKTYVLLLLAAKPSDVYVALSKTTLSREKAREYQKDKHLTEPRWKYEMIETFLNQKKRIQYDDDLSRFLEKDIL